MANEKSASETESGADVAASMASPRKAKRVVKRGLLLAAVGLTALAVNKKLKSRRAKAAKKKTKRVVRKAARKVKSKGRKRASRAR